MSRWKEFAEMLGVPFNAPFKAIGSKEFLIITKDGIGYWDEKGGFDEDFVLSYQLLEEKLTPLTLEGKTVWLIHPYAKAGYRKWTLIESVNEEYYLAYDRKMLFLTEEEAKQRVRELGWDNEY